MRWLSRVHLDVPALQLGSIRTYVLAFVATGVATVVRLAIDQYVAGFEGTTFILAAVITTLVGGVGAGLFCVVLSTVPIAFFLLPPRLTLYIHDPAQVVGLLVFAFAGFFSVIVIYWIRGAIQREQSALALEESKNRLQLALDTAQLGWWRYDPSRRVIEGDRRFKEIFDVARGEMAVEDIRNLVHPDDAERFWADRLASSDPADPGRSPHEYRVRRRDGEVRWVEVRWLAYFEGGSGERGNVPIVGVVHDITERKEREEREQLLMREINHRTKNMLTVVEAIAHQTATRTPECFMERFSERVRALAANQDLLIRNAWRGVEIEDLVRAHLAPFADPLSSNVTMHGPKLRLNATAAQSIGLSLHEHATNSGKYGAFSTDAGRLDVFWDITNSTFTVSWIEREGPPVSAPQRSGFGSTVIKAMAERNLDAVVQLDYAPCGVAWRLTCPAANVLEPSENSNRENQLFEKLATNRASTRSATESASGHPRRFEAR